MSSNNPRQRSAFWKRSAVALSVLAAAISLGLGISSCGSKGGKSGGQNPQRSPDPSNPGNPNSPGGAKGQGLNLTGRTLKLTDLRFIRAVTNMNWPSQPLSNEIRANKNTGEVLGFEFNASRKSAFAVLAYLTSIQCQSNALGSLEPDFALYSLTDSDELDQKISALNAKSEITLDPGHYAVTLAFDKNVSCSRVIIGFEASLNAVSQWQPTASPAPTFAPSPTPVPTTRPTPEPSPTASPNPRMGRIVPVYQRAIALFAARRVPGSNEAPTCQSVGALFFDDFVQGENQSLFARIESASTGADVATIYFEQKTTGDGTSQPVGSITMIKQSGYPDDWVDLVAGQLFSDSGGVWLKLSLDANCMEFNNPRSYAFLLGSLNLPSVVPTRGTAGDGMESLPLRTVNLENGKAAPLVRISYSYPGSSPAQWKAEIGLDTAALAESIGGKENLKRAHVIVMDRMANAPISPWIFFENRSIFPTIENLLVIDSSINRPLMEDFAQSVLNSPSRRSLVFRFDLNNPIDRNGTKRGFVDFVLDHGLFCQVSYTRPDGDLFHKAIFNDLTNPSWNDKPSKDQRTGCAFAGSP